MNKDCNHHDTPRFTVTDRPISLSIDWESPEIDPNACIVQLQHLVEKLVLKGIK